MVLSLSLPLVGQVSSALDEDDEEVEEYAEFDDDEEIPEPTLSQLMSFLTTNLPEALPLMARVRKEESIRDYQEVLERASEVYMDYHMARLEGEDEEASLVLDFQRTELQLEAAAYEWREADSAVDRRGLRSKVEAAATAMVDLEIKTAEAELAFLRRETAEMEQELDHLKSHRTKLISEIIADFLEE